MKKIVITMALILGITGGNVLAVGERTATGSTVSSARLIATHDKAKLYKAGKFNVLVLYGSYRQMGRQYGQLMKEDLHNMYRVAIENTFIKKEGISLEALTEASKAFYDNYPMRVQSIVEGIAETSGLEKEKLAMLAEVVTLVGYAKHANEGHCSAIAAWGEYTSGGPLVFGRDFDYAPYFRQFAEFTTVVVYNPDDGSIPVAQIGYVGQMDTVTAMNEAGLLTEINDGAVSGGYDFKDNKLAITIMPFTFLLDSKTIGQLDSAIRSAKADYAIIYSVADSTSAYSYEWSIKDVHKRTGEAPGLLIATNHFMDPAWNSAEPSGDPHKSVTRRHNLVALGEKYKGAFNVQTMMNILDLPYEKGGVTVPGTIYEIVAVPAKRTIYLKAPEYQDWVEINLNKYFEDGKTASRTK